MISATEPRITWRIRKVRDPHKVLSGPTWECLTLVNGEAWDANWYESFADIMEDCRVFRR